MSGSGASPAKAGVWLGLMVTWLRTALGDGAAPAAVMAVTPVTPRRTTPATAMARLAFSDVLTRASSSGTGRESHHVSAPTIDCNLVTMDGEDFAVADRLKMDDLLTRYATAIDNRDWALLDTVFTADAHLDYRSAGGLEGTYPVVRQWLSEVLPIFDVTQHLVVNREFERDNDEARARSCFLNPNRLQVDGRTWLFTVGGRYHDRMVRTAAGWRIAERVEITLWWDNPMPGLPDVPYPLTGPVPSGTE